MTQMKYISGFIQYNLIILFKLTVGFIVPLLMNYEWWFHPLNMQTSRYKKNTYIFFFGSSKTHPKAKAIGGVEPRNVSMLRSSFLAATADRG